MLFPNLLHHCLHYQKDQASLDHCRPSLRLQKRTDPRFMKVKKIRNKNLGKGRIDPIAARQCVCKLLQRRGSYFPFSFLFILTGFRFIILKTLTACPTFPFLYKLLHYKREDRRGGEVGTRGWSFW